MDLIATNNSEYQVLDAGDFEKLEQWGEVILRRPDPQAIWPKNSDVDWDKWDMYYHRSDKGGGEWEVRHEPGSDWNYKYGDLKFLIKPMGFKHTGVFPEQQVNWDFITKKLADRPRPQVLNLFGYTGVASVVALQAGAEVVHLDSSREIMDILTANLELNGLRDKQIRLIVDDAVKFVRREVTRGNKYDAIILDPPTFGRGTAGQVWKLEDDLQKLLAICAELISEDPAFVLMSTYATDILPQSFENLFRVNFPKAKISSGQMLLPIINRDLSLPAGIYVRAEF